MPFTTVWMIFTTPTRPRRARSSTSLAQAFGVVRKVPHEPDQFPHRLRGAIKTAGDAGSLNVPGSRTESRSRRWASSLRKVRPDDVSLLVNPSGVPYTFGMLPSYPVVSGE